MDGSRGVQLGTRPSSGSGSPSQSSIHSTLENQILIQRTTYVEEIVKCFLMSSCDIFYFTIKKETEMNKQNNPVFVTAMEMFNSSSNKVLGNDYSLLLNSTQIYHVMGCSGYKLFVKREY